MLSCTEFIYAYNELFKYIDERYGKQAVVKLWEAISDQFLTNLRDLVAEQGMRGMILYWSHTLTEEGGDWEMVMTPESFEIRMNACPSAGKLDRAEHIQAYEDYCGHCDTLYRRVLEPLGYDYDIRFHDRQRGACRVRITPKKL